MGLASSLSEGIYLAFVLHVVLVEPEIPPNTGNIARLCGATNTMLHLVKPLGFSTDDKALKRAGLDYWDQVQIHYWESWDIFWNINQARSLYFLSTKAEIVYTRAIFQEEDMLVFGPESRGLPELLLRTNWERCMKIPMANSAIRSINLSTAVGIVVYEAIRQINNY